MTKFTYVNGGDLQEVLGERRCQLELEGLLVAKLEELAPRFGHFALVAGRLNKI